MSAAAGPSAAELLAAVDARRARLRRHIIAAVDRHCAAMDRAAPKSVLKLTAGWIHGWARLELKELP